MIRSRLAAPALALLMTLAACGGDDGVDIVGDALSDAEAEALAEALAGTLFALYDLSPSAASRPAAVSGTISVDDSFPCEFGGVVDVGGQFTFNYDDETGDGTITYSVTQDHMDCVVESTTDIRFTLNGAPNVAAGFTIVTTQETLSMDGGFDGGVQWATGGRSGTCPVDVDFMLTGNLTTGVIQASETGSVCGVNIDHQVTVNLEA